MKKYIIMLIFTVAIIGCRDKKNNDGESYYSLYNYIMENNTYQIFKDITFVERSESDLYLYYNYTYNLSYWFSINSSSLKIEGFNEKLKKENSQFLASQFPNDSREIEKRILNNIDKSIYIYMKFHLKAINGWMTRDSLQIIDFEINDGSDLVYWEKITPEEVNSFSKGKIVRQLDNHWYYIKEK